MQFKKYTKQRNKSIQGLRSFKDTLPKNIKRVINKKGHIYSETLNNWKYIVGENLFKFCYPKSIKTGKELRDGVLFLNVTHGDQLLVEYSKKDIIDKINAFFGYQFVKEIRLVLVREKVEIKKKYDLDKNQISKYHKKIENIENSQLKKKLEGLIGAFGKKRI